MLLIDPKATDVIRQPLAAAPGAEHAHQGPGVPSGHTQVHGGVEPGGLCESALAEQPRLRAQGKLSFFYIWSRKFWSWARLPKW